MEKHETKPFFSIVIPALNEEHYLPGLLLDLASQMFRDFEVIIVDAGSEDQTAHKAQRFDTRFGRFRILQSDQRNVSHQRNLGAQTAIADWLIFFDADNRLPRHFVQQVRDLIEEQQPDLLSTWFQPDSEDVLYKMLALLSNITIALHQKMGSLLIREAFVCIKREAFFQLGGFDESIPLREGSALLKRARQARMEFRLYREPKFICSYRRVRKQGVLRTFIRSLQIELARLTRHPMSAETSRRLYPMEGGRYFTASASRPGASNHDSLKNVLRKIFKPL